jgi:hypothetical protein
LLEARTKQLNLMTSARVCSKLWRQKSRKPSQARGKKRTSSVAFNCSFRIQGRFHLQNCLRLLATWTLSQGCCTKTSSSTGLTHAITNFTHSLKSLTCWRRWRRSTGLEWSGSGEDLGSSSTLLIRCPPSSWRRLARW